MNSHQRRKKRRQNLVSLGEWVDKEKLDDMRRLVCLQFIIERRQKAGEDYEEFKEESMRLIDKLGL